MSVNTVISNWIDKAQPDYYTMFIKAWIPYNAWYMRNFYDESGTPKCVNDKQIINYIKSNNNTYKDRIISLLRGNNDDSRYFKSCLSNLHSELEAHATPNNDERIAFTSICITDNSKTETTIPTSKYSYKGRKDITRPKTSPRWIFEIISSRNMTTINSIELYNCSLTELKTDSIYLGISNEQKKYVEKCLNDINPKRTINIVVAPRKRKDKLSAPSGSITIDESKHLYFIDNYDDVSKAIIQIIYELRCKLFHGEIDPIEAFSGIYEYAFCIQKLLIKELK